MAGTSPAMTKMNHLQAGRERRRAALKRVILLALVALDVIATRGAGIELARASDLLVRILDHLAPLADPADGAGDRKQHGEHRGRETHRLQRDPRIEVYIRVELAFDEIFVVQRDLFQ